MRILVDSSNYFVDNDNLGDRAAFRVVGRRLLGLWPEASIRFITGNCRLIEDTHPGLRPLVLGDRQCMDAGPEFECYFAELDAADLIVATGGGYYSDAFAAHALGVLDTLEAACQLGKPAVMMSAGFEPVRDEALLEMARSVLPQLALIACREGATGPAYLRSLGVQAGRVVVTGDDSVELAYEARQAELGDAIGVNLRQAPYAGVDDTCIDVLRSVLADAGKRRNAPLVPVPISLRGPSDTESIAKLLGPARGQAGHTLNLNTPQGVVEQVGRCRLVVTGSYHAAVFALAQGIPVVAIADSLHYRTKLGGLAHQFGSACTLLAVHDERFGEKVADAIDEAWGLADELRPGLLAAAIDQIAAGQAAYQRLPGLLQPWDTSGRSVSGGVYPPGVLDHASRSFRRSNGQIEERRATRRPSPTIDQQIAHNGQLAVVIQPPDVSLHQEALSAVTRERDALQLICEERNGVIRALMNTCDLRQREIEEITAEAQRRDDVIHHQVTALAEAQHALDERTAWAERMVLEAERRGDVIAELQAAVEERTAWATRLIEEAEHRGVVIAELQAALTATQQAVPSPTNSPVARL